MKWLSPLTRGLLRITTQDTLSSTGKAIPLHLLAVHGLQIVIIFCTVQTVAMARTKQTKWRADSKQLKLVRQPSKWGTAALGVTHRPPVLPVRTDNTSGNPSYKGMS